MLPQTNSPVTCGILSSKKLIERKQGSQQYLMSLNIWWAICHFLWPALLFATMYIISKISFKLIRYQIYGNVIDSLKYWKNTYMDMNLFHISITFLFTLICPFYWVQFSRDFNAWILLLRNICSPLQVNRDNQLLNRFVVI